MPRDFDIILSGHLQLYLSSPRDLENQFDNVDGDVAEKFNSVISEQT